MDKNLILVSKSKLDSTENPNCAECEVKYDKNHLLMNCKIYQNNLKTKVNDTIQIHCDKSVKMKMDMLHAKIIQTEEAALIIKTFLIEFLSLLKDTSF